MNNDSLFNSFHGIFGKPQTIAEKIEEISIDEKQKEQINVMFDMGFEMGMAFARNQPIDRSHPDYMAIRKLYVETAGPMMVRIFNDIMKDFEKKLELPINKTKRTMGEIAEDMLDGSCCALCGVYFRIINNPPMMVEGEQYHESIFTHGYPVACIDCWDKDCGYEKATCKLTF